MASLPANDIGCVVRPAQNSTATACLAHKSLRICERGRLIVFRSRHWKIGQAKSGPLCGPRTITRSIAYCYRPLSLPYQSSCCSAFAAFWGAEQPQLSMQHQLNNLIASVGHVVAVLACSRWVRSDLALICQACLSKRVPKPTGDF